MIPPEMKKEQEYQMTCHNLTVSELNDQRNVLMYTRRAYVRQNPGGISAYLRFVLKLWHVAIKKYK